MTKILLITIAAFFLSTSLWGQKEQAIKVACIGNSITFGAGIKKREKNAYPPQLGKMLGKGYEVRNYGFSGRTLLSKGDYPYMAEKMFFEAINWKPEMVIIMLGTNDSKPQNWKFKAEFEADYNKLITAFDTLSSKPKIYLVKVVPVFKTRWGINDSVVRKELNPLIEKIAKENKLPLINLYAPLLGKGSLFPDDIHPNTEGSALMAKIIYDAISGEPEKRFDEKILWHGFDKQEFDFNERKAYIVIPKKALAGKPWVWRARFPNWHIQTDSILLSEGYHIAYINTNNMYGSPDAVQVWNHFYKYLVDKYGFNEKVSLEGVSRGGLYVYNWAKANPEKVNCIYAEAPVCDFTSWPGGFGTGKGSKGDWKKLKKEYGFKSDAEAKAYTDKPIDKLEQLAKAKVPVLHMIGLNDKVVPLEENTMVLINRYIKLGGIAKVVPCTEGKQDLWGHHFVIETPQLAADFIKYHTKLPKADLNPSAYHYIRGGLKNSFIKFEQKKKVRVAFLGGSITYNGGWRDSLMQYMQKRFPETEFEFIAAGIPSFGSTEDVFRMKRDILSKGNIDLLFVEAAVNDGRKGRSPEEIKRSMEGIVRNVRSLNPTSDIVFMYFVDQVKMKDYRQGKTPLVIQYHDEIAKYYDVSAINLAKEVTDRIDAGEFTWKDDFKNLHPSPFGQGVYARSMIGFLNDAWSGFVADDDKIVDYPMPEKLDKACYDNGTLIPAKEVEPVKGWEFVKNWDPKDKIRTRDNYIKVPMLIGEYPSKALKFSFEGNAVGIAVAAGPDAGIIEYRIDGGKWEKRDLFTKHSTHYHLPWYYTLADGLISKKHLLELRLTDKKNEKSKGSVVRIRYFYINK
jgi:lysophospholipase L1-like esterase